MDGHSSFRPSGRSSSIKERRAVKDRSGQEHSDIFVRAHTRVRAKDPWDRRWAPNWPRYCLIFDTETTLDPAQALNFGVFRRCKLVGSKYLCVAEGIFHRDEISETELKLMQRHRASPPTLEATEYFPAQTELRLMSRSEFISRVFWSSIRKGELIVVLIHRLIYRV